MKKLYSFAFLFLSSLSTVFATPWTQMQSMGGLGRHRAFSMSIGNRGYVGGGWNGNTMYFDMWEFDPGSNSWTQKTNLPTTMWSDPAFGINNRGYVMEAGYTYMYNPVANTWTIVNTNSPSATYYDQLKFVIGSKGYLSDGSGIYSFDPSTNQWTFCCYLPLTCYPEMGFAAAGKGYIVDPYYNYFFKYDPQTNVCSVMNSCPWSVSQGISFGVNGKGYIGLGQDMVGDDVQLMYEYDPATNSWRGISKFEGAGRENSTAFTIGSKAYVACGTSGINMNDCWEFDNAKVTGMQELSATDLIVYPTVSADGKFTVSDPSNTGISMLVVNDLQGKLITTIPVTSGNAIIDLSSCSSGTYLVSFMNDEGDKAGTRKVIVSK